MTDVLLNIIVSLIIIVPLAVKWGLPMAPVYLAAAGVGLLSGLMVNLVSLYYPLGFAARVVSAATMTILLIISRLAALHYRDSKRVTSRATKNALLDDNEVKDVQAMEIDAGKLRRGNRPNRSFTRPARHQESTRRRTPDGKGNS